MTWMEVRLSTEPWTGKPLGLHCWVGWRRQTKSRYQRAVETNKPAVEKFHCWFRSTASVPDKAMALGHANPRYVSDATKFGVTAPNLFEVVRKGAESVRKSPGSGPASEKRRNGRPSAPASEERGIGDGTPRPATRNRAVRAVAYR